MTVRIKLPFSFSAKPCPKPVGDHDPFYESIDAPMYCDFSTLIYEDGADEWFAEQQGADVEPLNYPTFRDKEMELALAEVLAEQEGATPDCISSSSSFSFNAPTDAPLPSLRPRSPPLRPIRPIPSSRHRQSRDLTSQSSAVGRLQEDTSKCCLEETSTARSRRLSDETSDTGSSGRSSRSQSPQSVLLPAYMQPTASSKRRQADKVSSGKDTAGRQSGEGLSVDGKVSIGKDNTVCQSGEGAGGLSRAVLKAMSRVKVVRRFKLQGQGPGRPEPVLSAPVPVEQPKAATWQFGGSRRGSKRDLSRTSLVSVGSSSPPEISIGIVL